MGYYSQFGEDKLLTDFFPRDYKGVCVEVGAYDGKSGSNTLYFEERGWKCLCVEPIPGQYEKCKAIRKEVVNCCVGEKDEENVPFTVFKIGNDGKNESAISSLEPDGRLIDSHKHLVKTTETILVKVRTLTRLLDEAQFPTDIDFISIDTENTELNVLKGFDLKKYNVKILVIENNYDEPFCAEYLAQFNYKRVVRIGVNDIFSKVT
jgi:FkbM family methyltransferase